MRRGRQIIVRVVCGMSDGRHAPPASLDRLGALVQGERVRTCLKWAPVLALGLTVAAAAPAGADDYCVTPAASCIPANTFTEVQPALDAAANQTGNDRVFIGAGTFNTPSGGLLYNGVQPGTVDIRGAGRDATILEQLPTIGTEAALRVAHSGAGRSAVSGLTVTVASGPSNFGLGLLSDTDARDIAVRAQSGVTNARGVDLRATSALKQAVVDIGDGSPAVEGGVGPSDDTRVEDSTLTARKGFQVDGGGRGSVVRTRVVATDTGLNAVASRIRADNVVVDMNHAGGGSIGLIAFGNGGTDASIDARNITVLGDVAGVNGAEAFAVGDMATMRLVDSIVRVRGRSLIRQAGVNPGDPPAMVSAARNDYRPDAFGDFSTGNGVFADDDRHTDDPHFVGDPQLGQVQLRFDSPLIDAGSPGSDEPTDDFAAAPRVVDGDGNGTAVRDLGAFEYQRRPPIVTVAAAPASALVGAPFDWSASASDAEGEPIVFTWSWDDGATAGGPSASHAFGAPGRHIGTVTATDASGASTSAGAGVDVTAATGPPVLDRVAPLFTIVRRGLRMSRKRQIAVRVDCAASEPEPCAGTLTLASTKRVAPRRRTLALGRGRFNVRPGRTGLIRVTASRSAAKIARRLKKVKVTATGVATDAAGNSRTIKRSLTLVIGRTRQ
jgi:hypothetical protein